MFCVRDVRRSVPFGNRLLGRQTECALVFATELIRARVADFIRGLARTVSARHHQVLRKEQALTLVILQRRHLGDRLEVTVERRARHVAHLCQSLDVKGLARVLTNPLNCAIDAVGGRVLAEEL